MTTFWIRFPANWVGLQNYRDVLSDGLFWRGVWRAFIFTSIFVPGMILIPMVIAVLHRPGHQWQDRHSVSPDLCSSRR